MKPGTAELKQLGAGTWAWLQPEGGWGETNAGLVRGQGESLLVDTLWDEDRCAEMIDGLGPLVENAPITTAFNTHRDGDHWWGNAVLSGSTVIWSSAQTLAEIEREPPPSAMARLHRLAGLGTRLPGPVGRLSRYSRGMLDPFEFGAIRPRRPTRTFERTAGLEVGGRTAMVEMLGPAHTAGDSIVQMRDEGVVFAGDLLFFGVTPVIWQGPVEGWIVALRRLLDLDAGAYVPGHGPVGTREDVQGLLGYWEWLAHRCDEEAAKGLGATRAMRALASGDDFGPYRGWVAPERLALNVLGRYRDRTGGGAAGTSPPERMAMFSKVAELERFLSRNRR